MESGLFMLWVSDNYLWWIIQVDDGKYAVENLRNGAAQRPIWGADGLLWDNSFAVPKYVRDAAERVIPRSA